MLYETTVVLFTNRRLRLSHDIIVLIAGCLLWVFGLLCGVLMERNNTKAGTPSASHNSAKPKCPKCGSSFSWEHGVLLKCGECDHEWKRAHRL